MLVATTLGGNLCICQMSNCLRDALTTVQRIDGVVQMFRVVPSIIDCRTLATDHSQAVNLRDLNLIHRCIALP